jgi:hypothetical protein
MCVPVVLTYPAVACCASLSLSDFQVFNYPLPPSTVDESTAKEMGWLPPEPVKALLADYITAADLPPLFDESQKVTPVDTLPTDMPGSAAAAAAAAAAMNTADTAPTAAAAAGGGVNGVSAADVASKGRVANGSEGNTAAAAAADGASSSSSLPNGLAARMRPGATPLHFLNDTAAAAAAAADRKRGRSPTGDTPQTLAVPQQQQQQQEDPAGNGTASSPRSPPSKKARPASAAAAAAVPGLTERRAKLASVPLPSRTLVLMAMTCASCREAFDFERLEFLGDVILKALAAHVILGVSHCDVGVT